VVHTEQPFDEGADFQSEYMLMLSGDTTLLRQGSCLIIGFAFAAGLPQDLLHILSALWRDAHAKAS
jgi:hypothetical protein